MHAAGQGKAAADGAIETAVMMTESVTAGDCQAKGCSTYISGTMLAHELTTPHSGISSTWEHSLQGYIHVYAYTGGVTCMLTHAHTPTPVHLG